CKGRSWFVDVTYLASIGGKLFTEWNEQRSKGIKKCWVEGISTYELDCLIDATAKYRQIVVTRMNYDVLVSVSFRYNISAVLRAVESFLMDAEWIHPIRRLEYAVCY
ncbi:hypothetical protein WUBG_15712, partial [Wuchereria bancrofti]